MYLSAVEDKVDQQPDTEQDFHRKNEPKVWQG
jgi:hypothetical protein